MPNTAHRRSLGDNRVAGRSGDMRGEARAEEGDSLSRGQERLSWAQPRMLWGQAEVTGGSGANYTVMGRDRANNWPGKSSPASHQSKHVVSSLYITL